MSIKDKGTKWMLTYWPKPEHGVNEDDIINAFKTLTEYANMIAVCRDTYSPERESQGKDPLHYHCWFRLDKGQVRKSAILKWHPLFEKMDAKPSLNERDADGLKYIWGVCQTKETRKEVIWHTIDDIRKYITPEVVPEKKRKLGEAFDEVMDLVEAGATNKEIYKKHRKFYCYNIRMINTIRRSHAAWSSGYENDEGDAPR